jgi:hypothetical protein
MISLFRDTLGYLFGIANASYVTHVQSQPYYLRRIACSQIALGKG